MSSGTSSDSQAGSSVEIVDRRNITCSNSSSYTSLPAIYRLSPLDQLVLTFIPVAVVFVYPVSPENQEEILPIRKLQSAISGVLDFYPHLTGRLAEDPAHGGAHIRDLGKGAELLEAKCHRTLGSFSTVEGGVPTLLDLPGQGEALLAPYDFMAFGEDKSNQQVLTIQHTRFKCGSVALGVRILHCLNDGKGFFQFIKDLGTVYQSLPETDLGLEERIKVAEPYLRDYELKATEGEKELARGYKPKLYYLDSKDEGPTADGDMQQGRKDVNTESQPEVEKSGAESGTEGLAAPDIPLPANPPKTPVTGQILHFSPSTLNTLRLKAQPQRQAETEGGPASSEYITTFDALSAHLLQRVYQARHRLHSRNPALGELGEVDILCPIDIRGILGLEKDGEFYPYNAVFTTSSPFTHEELYTSSSSPGARSSEEVERLRNTASRIHEMVRPFPSGANGKDQVQSTVEWIAAQPDRSLIKAPFRGSNASMMISQWNKLDMYPISDIEGGGRRAGLVAPPFTPISLHDGLGYLVPSPPSPQEGENGSGGIDVYLALRGDVWAELDVGVDGY